MERAAAKENILVATLPHVPTDGWTRRALMAGAHDAGFASDMAMRAFPDGMGAVVDFMSAYFDARMLAALAKRDLARMRVRDRVKEGVRLRLELVHPHREAVRRALSLRLLSPNAGSATGAAWRTASAIWYAAGDESTDFNYYTKRAILVGVHVATTLYWLDDRSEDCADTWAFLDRRIANAMAIPNLDPRSILGRCLRALPISG
ncbi:MAG: COQ9 family protein [Rhodospirillales bacterium]|jgi:ubiquinone biosynthesis protein COQ9|nr:COQ9 family protein [Rhodospirillales bacterium]